MPQPNAAPSAAYRALRKRFARLLGGNRSSLSAKPNPLLQPRKSHAQLHTRRQLLVLPLAGCLLAACTSIGEPTARAPFSVVEASIADIHRAIATGETSCKQIVQAYIDRIKAYNGVCTQLVTADGLPIPAASGYVRAGSALQFPTRTMAAAQFLPKLEHYRGLPLDLGRMEPTTSDPSVVQQYGMVAGWQKSGQLNALETINIRGERSVACQAQCDKPTSAGALAPYCPAACERFRQYPDALERAAELDAQFGNTPDFKKHPLYCTTTSIKNWYDVKDMRSTGGNDVKFALDAAPNDATVVAALRARGAIILAVSVAAEIGQRANGPIQAAKNFVGGGGSIRGSWGGHVCNPYDTERSAGPSSGGAGASVAANLVTFSICETTGGSCREPAHQNAVTSLVTTKGLMSEHGTATAQYAHHRPGIIARKLLDASKVLDALKNDEWAYFDSKDLFTAIAKPMVNATPYSNNVEFAQKTTLKKPLQGKRIGIVREYMVKHTLNDAAIIERVNAEIKHVLGNTLGADLLESRDPEVADDPAIANMTYTFEDALAEVIAVTAPEYLLQKTSAGDYEFAAPGYDISSQSYRVLLANGAAPLSPKLNLRRILSGLDDGDLTPFSMAKYLSQRADERVTDWPAYVANAKWRAHAQAAGARNAALEVAPQTQLASGIDRIKMRQVFRLAVLKVMRQNKLDAFVHPNLTVPQWKIGIDREPTVDGRRAAGPSITDLLGVPEIIIPAGFDDVVYEPQYQLNEARTDYELHTGKVRSTLATPMPFSLNFWAGPGDEAAVLSIAAAYEAATLHRKPPPDFGALAR